MFPSELYSVNLLTEAEDPVRNVELLKICRGSGENGEMLIFSTVVSRMYTANYFVRASHYEPWKPDPQSKLYNTAPKRSSLERLQTSILGSGKARYIEYSGELGCKHSGHSQNSIIRGKAERFIPFPVVAYIFLHISNRRTAI